MPITPEDRARENIDKLLTDAGWIVQDKRATNLFAGRGVAVREFPLKSGHGEADYLLFVDGAPIGSPQSRSTRSRIRTAHRAGQFAAPPSYHARESQLPNFQPARTYAQ